jgi:hypothetical protein
MATEKPEIKYPEFTSDEEFYYTVYGGNNPGIIKNSLRKRKNWIEVSRAL